MPQFVMVEADDSIAPPVAPTYPGDDGIDPRSVVLPNFSDARFKVTVAGASDSQLEAQLSSSVETIEQIGKTCTAPFTPTDEGLAPSSWHDKMEALDARGMPVGKHSAYYSDYSNVRAAERRVRAIRAEIGRRSLARKQEAERNVQAERDQHQHTLDAAAEEMARLATHVEKVAPVLTQIAALAEAIETAAGEVNLNKRLLGLRSRVEEAAKALGVEPPELPTIPEVPEAARRLYDALQRAGMQRGKQGIG